MSGTIIVQLIGVLTQPVITRLFSPAVYGQFYSILTVVSMLGIFAGLCYDRAIVLAEDNQEAIGIAQLTILIGLVFSCIFLIFLVFPGGFRFLFGSNQVWYVRFIIGLLIFFSITGTVLAALSNRFKLYGVLAKRQVACSLLNSFLNIIVGWLRHGLTGLVFANLLSVMLGGFLLGKRFLNDLIHVDFNLVRRMGVKHRHFFFYQFPGAFLDTISLQLTVLMLNRLLSSEIAGQYALANKILAIPLVLIGNAFAQVFYQEFSSCYYTGGDAKKFLINTWKNLFLLGLGPCLVLVFFAKPLFIFIFGAQWEMAGWFTSYLAIMCFAMLISSPTSTAFNVLGLQRYFFLFMSFTFIMRVVAIFIMLHSLRIGLLFYVGQEIFGIFVYNAIILFKLRK